jgi:polysaccharide export outer membrane protein
MYFVENSKLEPSVSARRSPYRRRTQLWPLVGFALIFLLADGDRIAAQTATVAETPSVPRTQLAEYKIGPLDKLNITVFEVKDLSLDKVQVDANGQLQLPLIGLVEAQGKTARELSAEIARRLDETYLRDPQVSVVVEESASQKVTVEGAVNEAGVFGLSGPATLLQAIALAKGVSNTADLKKVTIFRTLNGMHSQLNFDVRDIEAGRRTDPEVLGGDVIVVHKSSGKDAIQQAIALSPALYLLSLFH